MNGGYKMKVFTHANLIQIVGLIAIILNSTYHWMDDLWMLLYAGGIPFIYALFIWWIQKGKEDTK